MPYLDSNIPAKIFYSAFGAEVLRSARTTNDATIFQRNSKILINRMMKQGVKQIDCQLLLINYFAVTLMYFTSAITLLLNSLNRFKTNSMMM